VGSAVVTIRAAQAAELERLRDLTFESKAHWGYDRDLVRAWADGLSFEDSCERWVAEAAGELVAWAGLIPPQDGVAVLNDLWVDPPAIGAGIGATLFRHAEVRACELGARSLRWEAEPKAVGFYERMGAHTVGTATSSWGRELPVMQVEL
jgi:N-acetylglutamate synthase-like GNAT family acetyltransferase